MDRNNCECLGNICQEKDLETIVKISILQKENILIYCKDLNAHSNCMLFNINKKYVWFTLESTIINSPFHNRNLKG